MLLTTPPPTATEKTVLVGLEHDGVSRWDLEESMSELRELAATAGANVVDTVTQKLQHPTAPYYIGKGKAEEVAAICTEHGAGSIIFDDELSPAQGRNLETVTSKKILDRTQLILDIFARRARSREGRLQIELAQLQYLLPRLTRMWTHLSRQTGGIGTRGPGETQLEVDRRRVQERIARLQKDLEEVRKHRAIQREGRARHQWPVVAIVGYTNAGKSSLLNRLTKAGVLAEDKLFATLDTRTRRWAVPGFGDVLLSDTVGFVRNLPHHLVASFRSTLEEARHADLLLHIVDASNLEAERQIRTVYEVLDEIGVEVNNVLLVLNKVDRVEDQSFVDVLRRRFEDTVTISAAERQGMDRLASVVAERLSGGFVDAEIETSVGNGRLFAWLTQHAQELSRTYLDESATRVRIACRLPRQAAGAIPLQDAQVRFPETAVHAMS
jgi:GTP-binding protein HflX